MYGEKGGSEGRIGRGRSGCMEREGREDREGEKWVYGERGEGGNGG